jgi:hypothetical protein
LTSTVVDLIEAWHKYDAKHGGRLIQIRKAYLVLLSTMTSGSQKTRISDMEIMQKLYAICGNMLRKNAPEQLIKLLINTLHKSLPLVKPLALVPYSDSNYQFSPEEIKDSEIDVLPIGKRVEQQNKS